MEDWWCCKLSIYYSRWGSWYQCRYVWHPIVTGLLEIRILYEYFIEITYEIILLLWSLITDSGTWYFNLYGVIIRWIFLVIIQGCGWRYSVSYKKYHIGGGSKELCFWSQNIYLEIGSVDVCYWSQDDFSSRGFYLKHIIFWYGMSRIYFLLNL